MRNFFVFFLLLLLLLLLIVLHMPNAELKRLLCMSDVHYASLFQ